MSNEISLRDLDDNSKLRVDGTREKLNVNSPKAATGGNQNIFAAPLNLITQVNQDDVERQKEMAIRMAGGKQDNGEDDRVESRQQTLEVESQEQPPKPRNCARCLSCWLCCGSCRIKDPPYTAKSNEDSSEHNDDNGIVVGTEKGDAWETVDNKESNIEEIDQVESNEDEYALEISETEQEWLLDSVAPSDKGRKCLVLDLDETLVHSSFQPVECSFSIPIELDGTQYGVYVLKRPYVDEFIAECAKYYELVIFTASLSEYANPVIDTLDKDGLIKHRLFRESCVFHEGQVYVKDLSRLGRDIKDCIIIDNSPLSYLFHPTNAIGCTSWFGDYMDTELRDLLPVLRGQLCTINDVRTMLDASTQSCEWLINQYGDKERNKDEHLITE